MNNSQAVSEQRMSIIQIQFVRLQVEFHFFKVLIQMICICERTAENIIVCSNL